MDDAQASAQRESTPFALLFLDIDHFKAFNDSLGHMAGDAALREVGLTLRGALSSSGTAGRWGGEEFLALLPGADMEHALGMAERVRASIAARVFSIAGGLHLTCSVGVAALPRHARNWTSLVDAADRAMYEAKRGGRDRVCAATPAGEEDQAAGSPFSPDREPALTRAA